MDSLISVIVPVYRVEKYLDRCIESVVNQTYNNLEIILVDDGSPDNCPKMCDAWAKKDSRITVIHKSNSGVSLSRKIGYEKSHGEYVMFVDSDDWLKENAIELLYRRIVSDKSDMAISNYINVYENGETKASPYYWIEDTLKTGKSIFEELGTEKTVPYMVWAKLYKHELLENASFVNLRRAEDTVMTVSILNKCKRVSYLSDITYCYFQRIDSVMHNLTDDVLFDEVYVHLHMSKMFYERDMLSNAISYYKKSLFLSMQAKQKCRFRRLFKKCFTYNQRKILLKKNLRMYFRWWSLYIPFLYDLVQDLKVKVHRTK